MKVAILKVWSTIEVPVIEKGHKVIAFKIWEHGRQNIKFQIANNLGQRLIRTKNDLRDKLL